MNSQTNAAAADFAWQAMPMTSLVPRTVLCLSNGTIFSAGFSVPNNTGSLMRWNPTQKNWTNLGGNFVNTPGPMSAGNGFIYVAADSASNQHVVQQYNLLSNQWNSLNPNINGSINAMVCDSQGNAYIAGNFQNANGQCYVAQFTAGTSAWSEITGSNFAGSVQSMATNAFGNLVVLTQDLSLTPHLYFYNGGKWTELNISNGDNGISSLCYDTAGNIYLVSDKAVYMYANNSLTNLNAPIPKFPGTVPMNFVVHNNGVLYAGISGYTDAGSVSSTVLCYQNKAWTLITPPQLIGSNAGAMLDMAAHESSSMYLFIACGDRNVYDGKSLKH